MKKVTLLTLLLFVLIPVTSLFAADINVLSGRTGTFSSGGSSTLFTDSNTSAGASIPANATVTFDLGANYDISSIQVSGTMAPVNNGAYWNVNLLLSSGSSSKGVYLSQSDMGQVKILSASNIRTVTIKNASDAVYTLYDIKAFGSLSPVPVNTDASKFVTNNLKLTPTADTSVTLTWDRITSSYFKSFKVYQDNVLLSSPISNSLSIAQLVPGQTYSFKVTSVDTLDKEFTGASVSYTVPLPDTTPPAVPTGLKVVPDRYTALVTWNRPSDPDLAGYYVYLNGNRFNSTPITTESFNLTSLNLETSYNVSVSAIDVSGNISDKSPDISFTTLSLQVAPSAPTNLTATPYNGSVTLSWLPASAAKNYKVYVDGVFKLTTDSTSVKITELKNDQDYSFSVQAVNDIGVSPMSTLVTAKPSNAYVPDVTLGYKLADVSTGVSSWFSSYWLLLAFSIAIPLSFYIANRIKGLFA